MNEIKENTLNTGKYKSVLESLNAVLRSQGQPTVSADQDWITKAQNESKATLESLEAELKNAKAALNKEEIRVRVSIYVKMTAYKFRFILYRHVIRN